MQVKLCNPSLTHAMPECLEDIIYKALYKSVDLLTIAVNKISVKMTLSYSVYLIGLEFFCSSCAVCVIYVISLN